MDTVLSKLQKNRVYSSESDDPKDIINEIPVDSDDKFEAAEEDGIPEDEFEDFITENPKYLWIFQEINRWSETTETSSMVVKEYNVNGTPRIMVISEYEIIETFATYAKVLWVLVEGKYYPLVIPTIVLPGVGIVINKDAYTVMISRRTVFIRQYETTNLPNSHHQSLEFEPFRPDDHDNGSNQQAGSTNNGGAVGEHLNNGDQSGSNPGGIPSLSASDLSKDISAKRPKYMGVPGRKKDGSWSTGYYILRQDADGNKVYVESTKQEYEDDRKRYPQNYSGWN